METLQLTTRDGRSSSAQGLVQRFSAAARFARAGAIVLAGFTLGGLSIFIPVVHIISTWLLPLLSLAMAWYFAGVRVVIGEVSGPCPQCGELLTVKGGPQASDLWVRCTSCATPFRFALHDEG